MQQVTERDLIEAFRDAKLRKDKAEEEAKQAQAAYDSAENALIELLESRNAEQTARYADLGHVTLMKPRLFASYAKENEEKVFSFVREAGRDDLIKNLIHPSSLSGFVKELLENGQAVPDGISYYLKSSARFYAA